MNIIYCSFSLFKIFFSEINLLKFIFSEKLITLRKLTILFILFMYLKTD